MITLYLLSDVTNFTNSIVTCIIVFSLQEHQENILIYTVKGWSHEHILIFTVKKSNFGHTDATEQICQQN